MALMLPCAPLSASSASWNKISRAIASTGRKVLFPSMAPRTTAVKSDHCRCFSSLSISNSSIRRYASRSASQRHASSSTKPNEDKTVHVHHLPHGIRHVELNRPDKLNALNLSMFRELASAARHLRRDPTVRAVLLSGKGRAFCTGLDIKSILTPSMEEGLLPATKIRTLLTRPSGYGRPDPDTTLEDGGGPAEEGADAREAVQELYRTASLGNLAQDVALLWRNIPVPVVAVVHGMCFGGGLQIALGADMRYATPTCQLSLMETKWGLVPDMGATVTLRELVRMDVAKELTFTGRAVDGTEAERLGLVTRACADPWARARAATEDAARRSPDALAAAKALYQTTWYATEQECLALETEIQEKLVASWNQVAASAKNFGVNVPYKAPQDFDP